MKKVIALILLLAFCGQTFSQGFYYLDYVINKASFEQNCINKAKKWLNCNGKCQLMQKMIESEKKQQNSPEMKLADKVEVLSSRSFYINSLTINYSYGNNHIVTYKTGNPVDQPFFFFHPPGA